MRFYAKFSFFTVVEEITIVYHRSRSNEAPAATSYILLSKDMLQRICCVSSQKNSVQTRPSTKHDLSSSFYMFCLCSKADRYYLSRPNCQYCCLFCYHVQHPQCSAAVNSYLLLESGAALPRVGVELDFWSLVWFFGESYKTFLAGGEKKEEKKYLSRKSSYS
jgi:hypothetical protein